MQPIVFRGSESYTPPSPGPVVVIGNFDGVHLGHRALLAAAREAAGAGVVCAYTFDPFPRDVLGRTPPVPALQRLDERVETLARAGCDHVVVETFTREFAAHTARWFCDTVLIERLRATAVVVGWNFRFGRGRGGDVESLAAALPVPVVPVPGLEAEGAPISSTRIREAILGGDVNLAARLLGRPHEVRGPVVRGDARGRDLGFPTANVLPERGLLPAAGVYAVRALVDGAWRDGVANLGVRPTFGAGAVRLEVHLLDFSGDLYGQTLRIAFAARIRAERAFGGVDDLVAQIRADAAAARTLLASA